MTQQSQFQVYIQRKWNQYLKAASAPLFTAASLTITKMWKSPQCPPTDRRIKKMWYLYLSTYLYSPTEKEGKTMIYNNVDEPGVYYTKWNKSVWERQILSDPTYT